MGTKRKTDEERKQKHRDVVEAVQAIAEQIAPGKFKVEYLDGKIRGSKVSKDRQS